MKTKPVYVLTSATDNNYPEQALMSVYTARYHNPEAYIVLVVDDQTDKIFTGSRAEIIRLLSEKIVVPLSEKMTMMDKSRWLKTNMRNIVKGDFLFIDCDTIITQSLAEIDDCLYNVAAVPESHLPVKQFNKFLYDKVKEYATKTGWDVDKEKYYFSSGVIYVKDLPENYKLYELWHTYWKEGREIGVSIDQPSFAKANIAMNHPVEILDGKWNCVMYTHETFAYSSKILHFCSFRNMSYIFEDSFLNIVRTDGVSSNDFIKQSVLNPYITFLPFDNVISKYSISEYCTMCINIQKTAVNIYKYLNANFDDFLGNKRVELLVKALFRKKFFIFGSLILTAYKFYKIKLNKKFKYVSNTCAADNI